MKLKAWQSKADKRWEENLYKGTVEAATGTGKTYLGLAVVDRFKVYIIDPERSERMLIVVPTIALQHQWQQELLKVVDAKYVGLFGGGEKDIHMPIVVAVVNSLRNKELDFEYLILDEIHRMFSKENFTFIKNGTFNKILGLSATPERTDELENEILKAYAPVVYRYKRKAAIEDKVLSNYSVEFRGIDLTLDERARYEIYEDVISNLMYKNKGKAFMALPYKLRVAITNRKILINNASQKIIESAEIVKSHPKHKIIMFSESIKTADSMAELIEDSVVYHSKVKASERQPVIEKFRNGEARVLITVRALDEGLNIPNCDMAVVAAGNSVPRQTIQRIGRILRKSKGKHAKIIFLYCKGTSEVGKMKTKQEMFKTDATSIVWK